MIAQSQAPIFQQLAFKICDDILEQKFQTDGRIPSVRDLAADCEVNPNTVMKSYEWLTNKGIIYNKRGLGYFVSSNAVSLILQLRRQQFTEQYLPVLFRAMNQLSISMEDISELYKEYNETNNNRKI